MTGVRILSILFGVAIIFTLFRIDEHKQPYPFDSLMSYQDYENFDLGSIEDSNFNNYNSIVSPIKPLRLWLTDLANLHPEPERFLSISYYFNNGIIKGDWGTFDGFRMILNVGVAPLQMIWSLLKTLFGFVSFLFVR